MIEWNGGELMEEMMKEELMDSESRMYHAT